MTNERSPRGCSGCGRLPVALALLASLAVAPSARGADGAMLELFHGPDDTGSMKLKTLRIVLDGKVVQDAAPQDTERALYAGTVAPGVHKLEVEALLESGSSLFSYMDGYRIKMRSRLELEVISGEGVAIRSRILPKGGLTAPWADRNKLVLTLSAKDGRPEEALQVAAASPAAASPAAAATPEPAAPAPAKPTEPEAKADPMPAPAAPPLVASREPATPPVAATTRPATATATANSEPQRAPEPPAPVSPSPARASRAAKAPASTPTRVATTASPARAEAPVRAGAPEPEVTGSGSCEGPPLRFEFDKASLTPEAREALDRFVACVAASLRKVRVEGHTDAVGTDEYNRWLAWDRAAAAAAYLRERGLAPGRVTTRFVGKGRPVCREATEACYARNRRVEVITVE